MRIATVINYCSNDYRFLKRGIEEALLFSEQVIVPVCDHFFDGSLENFSLLKRSYQENPKALFLQFAYDVKQLYTPYIRRDPSDEDWGALWHSTGRYLAFLYLDSEIDWVLFLDADEIIEGDPFARWQKRHLLEDWEAYWLFAHTYRFRASERLLAPQQTGLLVKRSILSPLKLLSAQERFGVFAGLSNCKKMQVVSDEGEPMIHHYSWVRPERECFQKMNTWGKKGQWDWHEWFLRRELEKEPFIEVLPYFDPLQVKIPEKGEVDEPFSNVLWIDRKMAFAKSLSENGGKM